ncbi:hypothetical protein Lal_00033282 [Lupinus albus]|nr:hypothetical protein Lal_00033282 [Lupinus albus]
MKHFIPGPSNTSLLRVQDSHVSKYVWNGEEITFRARCNFWQSLPNERVLQLIRNTAFGPMLDIGVVEINNHLLAAMVERWRPETHTFHFPNGECTITLQDVAYQLVFLLTENLLLETRLLGVSPTNRQIMGQRVQHTWLESIYQELPEDTDEEVVEPHARAFILRMIGGFLMSDTSGSRVHLMYLPLLDDLSETFEYSWGSTVLACLYRGLCRAAIVKEQKEVGDAYYYFNHGHTTISQFSLQVCLVPYTTMNIMGPISDICRASVLLICFATVEWHATDRVMRQFGLQQTIPQDPPNFDKLHKMDLRGKNEYNWPQKHEV